MDIGVAFIIVGLGGLLLSGLHEICYKLDIIIKFLEKITDNFLRMDLN